ncbi:MAG: DUF4118 domain-containing protein [Clostridia bacterium]|nr:DUF4118 domain-containing protein [Clostridia bacterium]
MKKTAKQRLKNIIIVGLILLAALGISFVLQYYFTEHRHISTVFVFAVFLVSFLTDGYVYGIITAFFGVLAMHYMFTFPYFTFNFSAPETIVSAAVMIAIALLTSTLTVKLKKWEALKAEGEKERMRANLLRAISHDLRTPLTTIYGASSAIIENYESFSEEQKLKLVQGIKEDSQWLIHIVENLLSITKIDGGKVKIIKTPCMLEELADSVIVKFKKRYPEQKIELSLPEEFVLIPMDAVLIEQVILNILENAVQHANGMTKLSLSVYTERDKAIFEISDNGCGIEKERLEKIFSGYNDKTEENGDSKKRNAGIGLSVCATIIRAHGGTITAENAKEGGAVFRFALDLEKDNE